VRYTSTKSTLTRQERAGVGIIRKVMLNRGLLSATQRNLIRECLRELELTPRSADEDWNEDKVCPLFIGIR
jgi:hypothetical protein